MRSSRPERDGRELVDEQEEELRPARPGRLLEQGRGRFPGTLEPLEERFRGNGEEGGGEGREATGHLALELNEEGEEGERVGWHALLGSDRGPRGWTFRR